MSSQEEQQAQNAKRVQKHRMVNVHKGLKRCEVKIPQQDEYLIKYLASLLQKHDSESQKIRNILSSLIPAHKETITNFFQNSPFSQIEKEVDFSRDKDMGRDIEF